MATYELTPLFDGEPVLESRLVESTGDTVSATWLADRPMMVDSVLVDDLLSGIVLIHRLRSGARSLLSDDAITIAAPSRREAAGVFWYPG